MPRKIKMKIELTNPLERFQPTVTKLFDPSLIGTPETKSKKPAENVKKTLAKADKAAVQTSRCIIVVSTKFNASFAFAKKPLNNCPNKGSAAKNAKASAG